MTNNEPTTHLPLQGEHALPEAFSAATARERLQQLAEASLPLPPLTPGEEDEEGRPTPEVARRRAFEAWATAEAFNYYAKQAKEGIEAAREAHDGEALDLWQDLRSATLVAQASKHREAECYLPGVGRAYLRDRG